MDHLSQTILSGPLDQFLETYFDCIIFRPEEAHNQRARLQGLYEFLERHGKDSEMIRWSVAKEIRSIADANELFRSTSPSSLTFDMLMRKFAQKLISDLLIPIVSEARRATAPDPLHFELHLSQCHSAKEERIVVKNLEHVVSISEKLISSLVGSQDAWPKCARSPNLASLVLKEALKIVRQEIAVRFNNDAFLQLRGVSCLVFLRFICSTLCSPDGRGVPMQEDTPLPISTTFCLITVSKLIQHVAAGTKFSLREPHLIGLNDVIQKNRRIISQFLHNISSVQYPTSDPVPRARQVARTEPLHSAAETERMVLNMALPLRFYLSDVEKFMRRQDALSKTGESSSGYDSDSGLPKFMKAQPRKNLSSSARFATMRASIGSARTSFSLTTRENPTVSSLAERESSKKEATTFADRLIDALLGAIPVTTTPDNLPPGHDVAVSEQPMGAAALDSRSKKRSIAPSRLDHLSKKSKSLGADYYAPKEANHTDPVLSIEQSELPSQDKLPNNGSKKQRGKSIKEASSKKTARPDVAVPRQRQNVAKQVAEHPIIVAGTPRRSNSANPARQRNKARPEAAVLSLEQMAEELDQITLGNLVARSNSTKQAM